MRKTIAIGLVALAVTACGFAAEPGPSCLAGAYDPGANIWLRNPQTGQCESVDLVCGEVVPNPLTDAVTVGDYAVCDSFCETLTETVCATTAGCRLVYQDLCAPDRVCNDAPVFAACWGLAPSGPARGGGCAGLSAFDCARHEDCAAVHQSDWSGCADPQICDPALGDFAACIDRPTP